MLCTAFLWSLAGVFIKVIEWPPLAIVCTRSLVATITMYLFVRKQKFEWSWPMLAAALSYTAFTYCIILSTKLTTSANAVMMQYTAPIYVAFLSWFFLKEKIRKSDWFCLIAVIGGMALFFMDQMGGGSNLIGNIIAIGNGLSFAFLAPAPTTEHPKRIAAYQSFCVSPHSGIWASVREFMKKEKKP